MANITDKLSPAIRRALLDLVGVTDKTKRQNAVFASGKTDGRRWMHVRVGTAWTKVSEEVGGATKIEDGAGALCARRVVRGEQVEGIRDDGSIFPVELSQEERARYISISRQAFAILGKH